jgi:hypothetical protein
MEQTENFIEEKLFFVKQGHKSWSYCSMDYHKMNIAEPTPQKFPSWPPSNTVSVSNLVSHLQTLQQLCLAFNFIWMESFLRHLCMASFAFEIHLCCSVWLWFVYFHGCVPLCCMDIHNVFTHFTTLDIWVFPVWGDYERCLFIIFISIHIVNMDICLCLLMNKCIICVWCMPWNIKGELLTQRAGI